ncbi:hypothetical protein ACFE04_027367 [Oxalis oulophora]
MIKNRLALNVKKVVIGAFILRTIITNNGTFYIKKYIEKHTCCVCVVNKRISTRWLSEHYEKYFKVMPTLRPSQPQSLVREDVGSTVTRNMCSVAKKYALQKLRSEIFVQYRRLHDYAAALHMKNHGSSVELYTQPAVGSEGLVAGQIVDIANEARNVSLSELEYIYIHKTGCLWGHSWVHGTSDNILRIESYTRMIRLSHQVVDYRCNEIVK